MTAEKTVPQEAAAWDGLWRLSAQLQQEIPRAQALQRDVPQAVREVVLANFLAHHVRQGGFAQLFFNAQGKHLAEMAKMLQNVNAVNTLHFYERAVRVCLADKPAYQQFLASDFVSESALKNALHAVSLDYFASAPRFEAEAITGLQAAGQSAQQWLDGHLPKD